MLKLSLTGPDAGDPATMRYKSAFGFMITSSGLAAIKPPWTTLTAYDLNSGAIKWQIPLGGRFRSWRRRGVPIPARISRRSGQW
jgi:glucose dehydrogenase